MISLKKYLDSQAGSIDACIEAEDRDLLSATMGAYGSALLEMGNCSVEACAGLGDRLKQEFSDLKTGLSARMSCDALRAMESHVGEQLRGWGRDAARHYQQKACEVKELLLVMAQTVESVSARDQRCTSQMSDVTERLKAIASLDDLTEIRSSIEKSATDLKASIDRMTEEGKAVMEQLKNQVATYRTKLEEAEEIASRDALTGLSSRLYAEGQIEERMAGAGPFCVAILDIDGFKKVNDEHGHLTGDELLKQFGAELRSACRATDVIGRWGGDEFIVLFDCGLPEAEAQMVRLRKWICGSYKVKVRDGDLKLGVHASIGLAAHVQGEEMKQLLARADGAMYEDKVASRSEAALATR